MQAEQRNGEFIAQLEDRGRPLSINENADPDVRVDMEDRGRSLLRYMNN